MGTSGKILTIIDLPGQELDETGRGLLSYCARLALFAGLEWGAVTLQTPTVETVAGFAAYGTPDITSITDGATLLDTPVRLGHLLTDLTKDVGAAIIVLPHNDLGATLAPIIAATLDAALLTEVTGARQVHGTLQLSRSALGGRIAETREWDASRPLVLTVPVRALSQVLLPSVRTSNPKVTPWQPATMPQAASTTILTRIPPDPQTVDLTDAEVIFSAGKGCDATTFAQLQELCQLLNVSFGVTRPVYDLGWTGFERMVGQTGRTVTPRLYVALGISGSMHHVGGIKDSKRIVAVNNDPKAPIFPNVDEGFVANLAEVLPLLLAKARAACGGTA